VRACGRVRLRAQTGQRAFRGRRLRPSARACACLGHVWAMFLSWLHHVWTRGGLAYMHWYIASNNYYWDTAINADINGSFSLVMLSRIIP
jgi:hypothetical protein